MHHRESLHQLVKIENVSRDAGQQIKETNETSFRKVGCISVNAWLLQLFSIIARNCVRIVHIRRDANSGNSPDTLRTTFGHPKRLPTFHPRSFSIDTWLSSAVLRTRWKVHSICNSTRVRAKNKQQNIEVGRPIKIEREAKRYKQLRFVFFCSFRYMWTFFFLKEKKLKNIFFYCIHKSERKWRDPTVAFQRRPLARRTGREERKR